MSEKYFVTGRCQCGDIKYTISSAPLRMGQCHCLDCQRSTGTGHASNAFFVKEAVNIEGQTNSYQSKTDTGTILTRYFCPKCGSRLFGTNSAATNMIGISAGTLNNSAWFKPNAIVYDKRRPEWDLMAKGIPTFKEMPPAAPK